MFTGIVTLIGKLISAEPMDSTESGGGGYSLVIQTRKGFLSDLKLGDSIAINGK